MNIKALSQFIGVFVSVIMIYGLTHHFIISPCTVKNGVFNFQTGECLLVNGSVVKVADEPWLMTGFFFLALVVAYWLAKLTEQLLLKRENKKAPK